MATFNKVILMGRLTDNPEAPRTLPTSGTTVVKFRIAVGRSKKNPQTGQWENDPNPLYITCEAFHRPENRRDICSLISQYFKKGDPIFVEGRLQLDQWQDKTTGQQRSMHKVVVENFEFIGGNSRQGGGDDLGSPPPRSGGRGGFTPPSAPMDDGPPDDQSNGDIPF
jgi:single-strand DNA-binding protein